MSKNINKMIDSLVSNDIVEADAAFNAAMADHIKVKLETKRAEVAKDMFGQLTKKK